MGIIPEKNFDSNALRLKYSLRFAVGLHITLRIISFQLLSSCVMELHFCVINVQVLSTTWSRSTRFDIYSHFNYHFKYFVISIFLRLLEVVHLATLPPQFSICRYWIFPENRFFSYSSKYKYRVIDSSPRTDSVLLDIVAPIYRKLSSLYGGRDILRRFLSYVGKHRKDVSLCLKNQKVKMTSNIAELRFSTQS